MTANTLSASDFEAAYDLLAAAMDRVGRERESDFLARLALLLMQTAPDLNTIAALIVAAEQAVEPSPV